MIRLIVFDMAGTTVNEDNIVYKTLQEAINEKGFHFTLAQVLTEGAGKEKLQAIKSVLLAYAHIDDTQLAENIYQHFMMLLSEAYAKLDIQPQANAESLFIALRKRNISVALNTGYSRETASLLIEKLGWKKGVEFDTLVTAGDVALSRPYPDMILLAMDQMGISDAGEVIKVGDSIIDIEEGKNAGCFMSIGITTGAHTRQQLESANPDQVIDNLLDLLPLVDNAS